MPDANDLKIQEPFDVRIKVPEWIGKRRPVDIIRGGQWPGGFPNIPKPSTHHVSIIGSVEFHDYETFGSDQHGRKGFHAETKVSTDDISVALLDWEAGFGGEERVEIDMFGSLREDGRLSVTLDVRFYEGATEGTTELEDSKSWATVVPAGSSSNFSIHLANDEDDWATVTGTITNRRVK